MARGKKNHQSELAVENQNFTLDSLLTTSQLAEHLGLKKNTLEKWRFLGKGPLWIRVGGRRRYRLSDVAKWEDDNIRSSTSDDGGRRE